MQPMTPQALRAAMIEQSARALALQRASLGAWKTLLDAGFTAQAQLLEAAVLSSGLDDGSAPDPQEG